HEPKLQRDVADPAAVGAMGIEGSAELFLIEIAPREEHEAKRNARWARRFGWPGRAGETGKAVAQSKLQAFRAARPVIKETDPSSAKNRTQRRRVATVIHAALRPVFPVHAGAETRPASRRRCGITLHRLSWFAQTSVTRRP